MNIHEYQAKELLAQHAISIPKGAVAFSAEQAEEVASGLGGSSWVVKAQIRAGDRGKAGGVKAAASTSAVAEAAREMLGRSLVTAQTGSEGERVKCVYVEHACDIEKECYLGMLVDRDSSRVSLLASPEGGMRFEEAVSRSPDTLLKISFDGTIGVESAQVREVATHLRLQGDQAAALERCVKGMYDAFLALDASLIEINPLVVTGSGELLALDAKMSIDDNALFRHDDLQALRDDDIESARRERESHGFNYVRLEGNIGCLVTGAGLALATMDILKHYGGEPADFLDLPPTATRVQIAAAFELILSDPKVKVVLVNAVGGGITRCDVIAEGMTTAAREVTIDVPVIVRFAGASKEMGVNLIQSSRMKVSYAETLADAAAKAVNAARGAI